MRIFVSWSGTRSRLVAKVLYDWIPQVIQEAEPWMSDEDIAAGGDWSAAIKENLDVADFGIICVTPNNMMRPWILFEAGALSKAVGDSPTLVAPFLIGFNRKSDLPLPLSRFQSVEPILEDVKKLMASINSLATNKLSPEKLNKAVEKWWNDLYEPYVEIRDTHPSKSTTKRSDRDVLDEILGILRSDQREGSSPNLGTISATTGRMVSGADDRVPGPRMQPTVRFTPEEFDTTINALAQVQGFELTGLAHRKDGRPYQIVVRDSTVRPTIEAEAALDAMRTVLNTFGSKIRLAME